MSYIPPVLKILVIEDHLGDFILIEDYLNEIQSDVDIKRACTFEEAKTILKSDIELDAILLDLSLPDVDDREILVKDVVEFSNRCAVIVLTGFGDRDFGVKTLSLGISDYLLKDELNVSQLSKSIFYSIERKKSQKQLSESEKNYKALFNHSPMPMWVLDRNSLKFLSVNDAALELYQYTREEFMNFTVRDLWVNPEPKIEIFVQRKRHDFFGFSISHKKKDGEIMHLEIQSNPISFDGHEARVTLVNNVTARIKAEDQLARSDKRFKALVQEASDLVMILDFNGNFSHVSPSSDLVMGIPADQMLEMNFFDLIHREDINQVKKNILKLKNNKRIQIPSYRIKTSSNEWRWIETVFTNLIMDPAVNGLVANSRDVTEFVNQERKLMDSLQRYDIVAKATSDTISDYDVQKDILKFNEGIFTMFGYKIAEIKVGRAWWRERIHPEDRERLYKNTDEVYKFNKSTLQIEYRFRCADGSYRYVLDRSFLVKDSKGNPLRIIGSMQDITEIQNHIQTIEDHNERLKDIAWTQSHVVRAPLARIMGIIDLMQTHDDIVNQEELLKHILHSATELDGIIRKITNQTEQVTQNFPEC
ncbi:PAS domain S-box protein [Gillisia limnaea]|uniref:histidine kinase n=1 Tax=Gillisia limnaea (strain DSM 15749 / LMG 21470 / R-8282) TaxID=865937 RepID=H2BRJ4_GILLR|nr:PAS domain S-box protein [Gillisia limnaea]EHQ04513.1 putative PAS/PAC sensor protein [Gillisia limnaea DSM 15749]